MSAAELEPPTCPNVLLSIKPEYADAILNGKKKREYRRVAPKRGTPMRLVLYVTDPIQAALGEAWCLRVREGSPEILAEETARFTPHDREDILDYFGDRDTGYALSISNYRRFENPLPRSSFEAIGLPPAQNFRYMPEVESPDGLAGPWSFRIGGGSA